MNCGAADQSDEAASIALVGKLLIQHERQIRGYIRKRSGPQVLKRTTIDDIYQQTAVGAVTCATGFEYRDDAGFIAWVQTIARRVIVSSLDRRKRKPITVRLKGPESTGIGVRESQVDWGGQTPSSIVSGAERRASVFVALKELPEHYQRVIKMYKLEQRGLSEVAQEMGRSKRATCQLFTRALEQLSKKMIRP